MTLVVKMKLEKTVNSPAIPEKVNEKFFYLDTFIIKFSNTLGLLNDKKAVKIC